MRFSLNAPHYIKGHLLPAGTIVGTDCEFPMEKPSLECEGEDETGKAAVLKHQERSNTMNQFLDRELQVKTTAQDAELVLLRKQVASLIEAAADAKPNPNAGVKSGATSGSPAGK